MDVVKVYLYGKLDTVIYMKAPPELITRMNFHIQGEKGKQPVSEFISTGTEHTSSQPVIPHTVAEETNLNEHSSIRASELLMRQQPELHTDLQQIKKTCQAFAVQILRSIYGLKQSNRIWYRQFKEEMLNLDFVHGDIAPYLFVKQKANQFVIIAIYVWMT